MKLYNLTGRLINKNVSQFLIDWEKKSRSNIQFEVKQFLKPFWKNHICYEEFPVFGSRMKVDFINFTKKIAIEVNGEQHYNRDGTLRKYYQERHDLIESAGWKLLELHYKDCYNEDVVDKIKKLL